MERTEIKKESHSHETPTKTYQTALQGHLRQKRLGQTGLETL
jgi:hypothetical protein